LQYKYRAVSEEGHIVEGLYEAKSEADVIAMLKNSYYMPIKIEETYNSGISKKITLIKIRKKDLAVFCRQFFTMLNAGVSIVKSLDVLEKQCENKLLKKAIRETRNGVQKGMTLSEAMKNNENIFQNMFINMIEVGEISGSLDIILERMALYYEKENKIENKIKGAMVYPAILIIVAIAVVIFLLVSVMPVFISMFLSSGIELPLPTRIILKISNSITNYWYIYVIAFMALLIGIKLLISNYKAKLVLDMLKIKIPIIKETNIKIITSRFSRILSILLASGISLIQSIDIVSKVIGNMYLSKKLEELKIDVSEGVPLSITIKSIGFFPPMLDSMINVGEESGALDEILNKCADFYEEEVEHTLQKLTELIQPALIIMMAIIVGFVVLAIALPMFELINIFQI